jgi:hypothetical protein
MAPLAVVSREAGKKPRRSRRPAKYLGSRIPRYSRYRAIAGVRAISRSWYRK